MGMSGYDIAVIGGGIAGASVAAELAGEASVLLLEMESRPGYHTTGRSAAVYAPSYGPAPVRALTRASGPFFRAPPEGFASHALLAPRATLFVAREDQAEALAALRADLAGAAGTAVLDAREVLEHQPLLRPGYGAQGLLDEGASDIDVAALHQGYLRRLRALGGRLETRAEVSALTRAPGHWRIDCRAGSFEAGIVINAAGAWADRIGAMAQAGQIGLQAKRRTALTVDAPGGIEIENLPLTVCVEEEFYLKPDAGKLLISPANADPMPPCDVQPEELDVAICIDRIERAFALSVRRVASKWAGLRSFVADGVPVAGFSAQAEGFFWLAGQGGYGIQTAPALARVAASLVLGESIPADVAAQGLAEMDLAPARLEGQAGAH